MAFDARESPVEKPELRAFGIPPDMRVSMAFDAREYSVEKPVLPVGRSEIRIDESVED